MFLGKNKISSSPRSSVVIENGHINSTVNKTPNLINLNETKPTNQSQTDHFSVQSQYGKTLNVPNTKVLQVLPIVTPAAPINPPRTAIMTTPKSSTTTTAKNSSTETRPFLLITTINEQQQPKTITVPNDQRLPLNGRSTTIASTQQRQQPIVSMVTNNHQMINEKTPKKPINNRPRTALYLTSSRMKIKLSIDLLFDIMYLGNLDQSSEQYQPLLNNGNDSMDDWSVAPRLVIFSFFENLFNLFSFSESYHHHQLVYYLFKNHHH